MTTERQCVPMWHAVTTWEPDDCNPNQSATYVMPVGTKGVLVRAADWSLGSLSVALEFVPGACLGDFGIVEPHQD